MATFFVALPPSDGPGLKILRGAGCDWLRLVAPLHSVSAVYEMRHYTRSQPLRVVENGAVYVHADASAAPIVKEPKRSAVPLRRSGPAPSTNE